jgi:hypothetical protein
VVVELGLLVDILEDGVVFGWLPVSNGVRVWFFDGDCHLWNGGTGVIILLYFYVKIQYLNEIASIERYDLTNKERI